MTGLDPSLHTKPLRFFLAINISEVTWLILNGLFYAAASTSLVFGTYCLGRIVDILQSGTGESVMFYVWGILGSLVAHEAGYRIGHIIEIYSLGRIRNRTKKALFDHTASLSFGYFADRFAGEIAHKISVTANALERMAALITNGLMEETALVCSSIAMLLFLHPYLGLFVIVWLFVFLIGIRPFVRKMNIHSGAHALREARTTGTFVDLYGNIATVKVYGHDRGREKAHEMADKELRAYLKLGWWSVYMYNYEGVSIVMLGSGLLVITSNLYASGILSVGEIVIVAGIALRLMMHAWEAGRQIPDFIRNRGEALQNLEDLVVAPGVVDGIHDEQRAGKVGVEYRDVTFAYAQKAVLKRFSITIAPGEKIGIVGLSGAGKTTFANLLLRFFDVQEGTVFLNDRDVRDYSQEDLRSHISHISQDTMLFHASIAENIAYGSRTASQAEIEHAARLAYADEFIRTLPHGYESVVGERGIKLSGGQRQRIAIARAILANRPLFLLDEATSALDSESEEKIQKGLATLMEGKTVIAIAHRLSTLSHLDRIVYLENGAIAEDGTHDELLARGGKYAKLWHMQAGGFLPADL